MAKYWTNNVAIWSHWYEYWAEIFVLVWPCQEIGWVSSLSLEPKFASIVFEAQIRQKRWLILPPSLASTFDSKKANTKSLKVLASHKFNCLFGNAKSKFWELRSTIFLFKLNVLAESTSKAQWICLFAYLPASCYLIFGSVITFIMLIKETEAHWIERHSGWLRTTPVSQSGFVIFTACKKYSLYIHASSLHFVAFMAVKL